MSEQFVFLQDWLKKRTPRDRNYLFFGGFIFLYLIYFIFFHHPLSKKKQEIQQQVIALQTQQATVRLQIDKIKETIKNPMLRQMLEDQRILTEQLNGLQQQLDTLKPSLSGEELPNLTKKILSEQRNNVILISLNELPVEPWPPENENDKTNSVNAFSGLYQHILQIEFQNDYFSTIDYLQRLEKISAHMYWDSMTYKVLEYPKAAVVIKFHVLSLQKS